MANTWNNLSAGKIQAKRVLDAANKLSGLAYLRRLKEPPYAYAVDVVALSTRIVYTPRALELLNEIHAKHGGTITKQNANAVCKDLMGAIAEADALVPVITKL